MPSHDKHDWGSLQKAPLHTADVHNESAMNLLAQACHHACPSSHLHLSHMLIKTDRLSSHLRVRGHPRNLLHFGILGSRHRRGVDYGGFGGSGRLPSLGSGSVGAGGLSQGGGSLVCQRIPGFQLLPQHLHIPTGQARLSGALMATGFMARF